MPVKIRNFWSSKIEITTVPNARKVGSIVSDTVTKLACVAALLTRSAGLTHAQSSDPNADLIAFDKAAAQGRTQNAYCQARLKDFEHAAEKYGFEFQVFDANFNPAEQAKQVQT